MNSGMEAEGHRSPKPIQIEDPNIVGFSLADPAITTTERRRYLYVARASLGQGTIDTRPPSFAYGDEEPISLENVPVFTSTLKHTLIAPPEVIRRIEEAKHKRLAAEAATGIKRPREQGVWFSEETLVIGDPCPQLLHYVQPVAQGTKLREDPNSDSSESGSGNN